MNRLHPVSNVVKLTPAHTDPFPGRWIPPPPPPEIIDREEEWVVEEILDSRVRNQKLRYLVKWQGFGAEQNSWEPWDNVHALELLTEFHHQHPGAARRIRAAAFDLILFRSTSPTLVPRRHLVEGGVDVRGHPFSPFCTIPSPCVPFRTNSDNTAPKTNLYIPLHRQT